MHLTIAQGTVFSIGLPACHRGATNFLQMTLPISSRWLRLCPTTWPGRSAAIKKAPSCSSSHRTTIQLTISSMLLASLPTTFLPPCTNFTSLWSTSNNFSPLLLKQLSRVSPPTAPSPTRSRLSALVGLPPSLSPVKSRTSSPKPRKPKPTT